MSAINQAEFLVAIYSLHQLFTVTLPLSRFLQSEDMDLTEAMGYADHCKSVMKEIRNHAEKEFHDIFTAVTETCDKQNVDENSSSYWPSKKSMQHPGRFTQKLLQCSSIYSFIGFFSSENT